MKKVLVITAVCAMAALSLAQGGGGGRGQFRMMRGGGGGSMSMLLNRNDVQRELGLSAEQKTKLNAMREKQMTEMRAQMGNGGRGPGGGGGMREMTPAQREQMQKRFQEMEQKANKELAAILSAAQMKRLKELSVQRAGTRAVLNPTVQAELALTAPQKQQIESLMDKQRDASRALMEKVRNQEMEFSQVQSTMQKNERILDEEIKKVLTASQESKLKAMGGKPFTFDSQEDMRGGRGMRREGGGA